MNFYYFTVVSGIRVFEGDNAPNTGSYAPYNLPSIILFYFRDTTILPGEVRVTSLFTTLATHAPSLPPSISF